MDYTEWNGDGCDYCQNGMREQCLLPVNGIHARMRVDKFCVDFMAVLLAYI